MKENRDGDIAKPLPYEEMGMIKYGTPPSEIKEAQQNKDADTVSQKKDAVTKPRRPTEEDSCTE